MLKTSIFVKFKIKILNNFLFDMNLLNSDENSDRTKIAYILESIRLSNFIVKLNINIFLIYLFLFNCLPKKYSKQIRNYLIKFPPLAASQQVIIGLSLLFRLR